MSFRFKTVLLCLVLCQPAVLWAETPPLNQLRAARSADVGFLHPDVFLRADMVWPGQSWADGEVSDIADALRQGLNEGDLQATEYRLRALVSMAPQNSAIWVEAAGILNRAPTLQQAADPVTRLSLRELAVSVALNGWLTALDDAEATAALDTLAEALVLIGDLQDAAAVGNLRLSIAPDDSLQASVESWAQDIDHLGAPQPHAYPVIAPVERYFGNWTVACDNAGSCSATNIASIDQNYGARLDLTRDAGPFAAPHLSISLRGLRYGADGSTQEWAPQSRDNVFFADPAAVNDPLFGQGWTHFEQDAFYLMAVPAAATRAMTDILASQPQIAFGETAPEVSLDLGGASEAFAFIDSFQGRTGSQTALITPGSDSDLRVPMPGHLPVNPAALVDGTQIDGTAPTEVLDLFLDNCADAGPGLAPSIGFHMSHDLDIWFVQCVSGAYNTQYMGFALDSTGELRRLEFPDMPVVGEEPGHLITSDLVWSFGLLRNLDMISYDPAPKTGPQPFLLVATNMGRGLGDCGERLDYLFDGETFRLNAKTQMDCLGWPSGWPYVWRTGRFGAVTEAPQPVAAEEAPYEGGALDAEYTGDFVSNAFYSRDYMACVENADTATQATCADQENARWDKRLNAAYKALMGSDIPPQAKADLKSGQRAWLKARDSFCPLTAQLIDGSMGVPAVAFCTARMTALRTEFLEGAAGIYPETDDSDMRLDDQRFSGDYQHCAGDAEGGSNALDCEVYEQQGLGGDIDGATERLFEALDSAGQAALMTYTEAVVQDRVASCRAIGAMADNALIEAHCRTVSIALDRALMMTWGEDAVANPGAGE